MSSGREDHWNFLPPYESEMIQMHVLFVWGKYMISSFPFKCLIKQFKIP